MLILNGTANGDTTGNFASFQAGHCNVICSEDILDSVDHMIISQIYDNNCHGYGIWINKTQHSGLD